MTTLAIIKAGELLILLLKIQIKTCAEMNVKELWAYVNSTIIGKIKKSECTIYIFAGINKT